MPDLGEPLSERELDVLHCVVKGVSNRQIALELAISPNTVKVHLRNIFTKLGVTSRTEASTVAWQSGLLSMPGVNAAPAGNGDRPEPAEPAPTAAATESLPASPGTPPARFRLRLAAVVLGLALVVPLVIPAVRQAMIRLVGTTATAEPFSEQQVGDSRWFAGRPLPEGLANMAVAAVGLNVYRIGGETAAGVVGSVEVYDTSTHGWRSGEAKPTAVADAAAAVLFGEIYVIGGRLADGRPTAVVETYSPANNAWREVAALPRPLAGALALADGSFLYLFGGWDGQQYLADSYVYDPAADAWSTLVAMVWPRAYAAGGVVASHFYVVGGYDGQDELDVCEYFEATRREWRQCPAMLRPRGRAGAAVVVNRLYVIGGGIEGDVTYSEQFDPTTQTWHEVETPMLTAAPAWIAAGIASVETRIYVLGGRRDQSLSDTTYVYAPLVFQFYIPSTSFEPRE